MSIITYPYQNIDTVTKQTENKHWLTEKSIFTIKLGFLKKKKEKKCHKFQRYFF